MFDQTIKFNRDKLQVELDYTMEQNKKMKSNTEKEYNEALASDDPTKITKEEQERLTREAIKKFKSLS